MASEVGVLDIPPENVKQKGRLQPGRMFLVDTKEKRIVSDDELKQRIASAEPYAEWLKQYLVKLEDLPTPPVVHEPDHETVLRRQETFGYTAEDLKTLINPMATSGSEPLGSMGTDTPLAVLSEKPQLLYGYFKQLFAQVTNPPVDAIREEIIMGIETAVGPEGNLLEPTPESCRQLEVPTPVLTNEDLERLRALDGGPASHGFRSMTIPALFQVNEGGPGLRKAIENMQVQASEAIAEGHNLLIVSDRGHDEEDAPIPALLAVSAVHHHLLREGTRTRVGIVVESGEPREVHHFALLIGFGASAVNPYLAFETIHDQVGQGLIPGPAGKAEKKYIKALNKGIVKVISKMGISTIQSYHGAQVFEAVGLNQDFIDEYFTWTASRIGGVGIDVVAKEVKDRHYRAYPPRAIRHTTLGTGGQYQYRADGEYHLFNPETVHRLQYACRTGSYEAYKEYAALVNNQSKTLCTLRGLMDFKPAGKPVPLAEVESVESILHRFKTGAMSYGSISQEAHEALAVAMNRIGGKSNTGEGGEDPARYKSLPNGDSKNSAIKQVASGRFGVTSDYLVNAQELQIKIAQGAKPGEGGQLPGSKVYPWIAKVRHSTPGVGLISPPPHHDIYSIEDLAQLIHDLKNANRRARVSVKLVAEVGVGTIAAGVAKAHADVILISGYDGGTGASPLTSIKHAGIPWELGLAEAHQVLLLNNLRSRVTVEADGQLKTGRDVAIAALLGAEEFGFATAPLVVLGCVMMRVCHLNTCPVGVATQDPELRKRFTGDPAHVVNFMRFVATELREYMAELGFRTLDEMVGHSERLEMRRAVDHWKARNLDFTRILFQPKVPKEWGRTCQIAQDHGIDQSLDVTTLLDICRPAIEQRKKVEAKVAIRNVNRVVGTIMGSELTRRWGAKGLPDDTIRLTFAGLRRPELRRLRASRDDARPGGRRQRLHRQGALRRPHRRLPAARLHLRGGGERHRRERGLLRRHRRRGLHPRRGRRALLRPQLRRHGGGRGGRRPRLRVHDRRAGGGAREDRAQLRGRHVGRHRLGARRGRRLREGAQPGDGLGRAALRSRPRSPSSGDRGAAREGHRVGARPVASSTPGRRSCRASCGWCRTTTGACSRPRPACGPRGSRPRRRRWRRSRRTPGTRRGSAATRTERQEEMGKPTGFIEYQREPSHDRSPLERIRDWDEFHPPVPDETLRIQGARCMDCGLPFCHTGKLIAGMASGCPLNNLIPEWNDLVYKGQWQEALIRLQKTNNFAEFTGRVCPAPCEGSCTVGISGDPVTIKSIEVSIIDRAFEEGWVLPDRPQTRTGYKVAVIGSGPAGLACAAQLNRAGHSVTVFERADRIGGLLMYGIPNMKLDKGIVQRRVNLMADSGIRFITGTEVGKHIPVRRIQNDYDAAVLCVGATKARDLPVDGRSLHGIHLAMDFLTRNTKSLLDSGLSDGRYISAAGRDVVVIGGGDTGTDCVGTSIRHGAKSVTQLEILPRSPDRRAADNPWPQWPKVHRTDYGQEEAAAIFGKDPRIFGISTKKFVGDAQGRVKELHTRRRSSGCATPTAASGRARCRAPSGW